MSPMSPRLLALSALLSSAVAASAQTTWHVDLGAVPPGDGSPGSPYTSLQHAIDQAATVDGDTLLVAPGTYVETIDNHFKRVRIASSSGPLETVLLPASAADQVVVTLESGSLEEPLPSLEGFTVTRVSTTADQYGLLVSEARLVRCIVTGHDVGIANPLDAFLDRCTVTENRIGIQDVFQGIHFLQSTICWGNTTNVTNLIGGGVDIAWSDVGGLSGLVCGIVGDCTDSFDADPLFWNAAGGDFHLRPGSPCIDTGDDAELDPDGSRRDVGAVPYDPAWAPGTQGFCFGSAALCPCANGGSGDGGCDLPQATGGVVLNANDFDPNGAGGGSVKLVGTGYPPAAQPAVTLIRSPSAATPPVVFGDGLRCIATSGLVRIGAVLASGGASLHTVNHGAGAGTFHYQLWTRSTPSTFCDPNAAFNLSNGLEIVWP